MQRSEDRTSAVGEVVAVLVTAFGYLVLTSLVMAAGLIGPEAYGVVDASGLGIALFVSIRLLYHLYQGPAGVIAINPMGLLFAFVYHRWHRLWPLVFAHGLLDALGILNSR